MSKEIINCKEYQIKDESGILKVSKCLKEEDNIKHSEHCLKEEKIRNKNKSAPEFDSVSWDAEGQIWKIKFIYGQTKKEVLERKRVDKRKKKELIDEVEEVDEDQKEKSQIIDYGE